MTRSRQTADWGSRAGLAKIVPSSVAVGSGTGSADSLGTVTFTGVSSVSLNSVFSSKYDNYRINVRLSAATATDPNLIIYGRIGTTDNTTNTVSEQISQYAGNLYGSESTVARFGVTSANYANFSQYNIEMKSPNIATTTIYNSSGAYVASSGVPYQILVMGYVFSNQQFDGFTILPASGTFTGTVSIYGYTQ